jgi:hypothetical protein
MPDHRIEQVLKSETEFEHQVFPNLSIQERAFNAQARDQLLRGLRFPRGTDWAKDLTLIGNYRRSYRGMKEEEANA